MTASKIIKIIINKFGEYSGEINLQDCTLINCVYLNTKEISKLTNILKFLFSNEESSELDELQHTDTSDCTYIEVHIRSSKDETCILKKSYSNKEFKYEINETESTQLDFQNKLQEHRCMLTYTSYLSPNAIESLMNLNDDTRVNIIESICGNLELKSQYSQHKTKMGELEISMKLLNEHKKEFFSEKKNEKLRIENSKKIKKAAKEFEKTLEQFSLMQFYHNEKRIKEVIPEKINDLLSKLDDEIAEYKINYLKSKDNLRMKVSIDRDVHNSDVLVNKLLNKLIAFKKNILTSSDELESIDIQIHFANFIEHECVKYKAQVVESTEKLQHLESIHAKYIDSITQYTELRNKFFESNYDFMLYISTKRQIDQFEMLKQKVDKNKLLIKCMQDENALYEEHLEILSQNEKELLKSLNELSTRIDNLKPELMTIENVIKTGRRTITDKLINNSYNIKDIKRVEQILREKFSDSIIGILSELFDVKESSGIAVTKLEILDCLGKYSNAIVIENPSTLMEVSKYLKMQQNEQISIILLPQKFYELKSPINLKNKSLPNFKMDLIENFLEPVSDEIKTILLHFLEPTVVCDSMTLDGVYKIFNHLGKNVKVTSFAAHISLTPKKVLQVHSTVMDSKNLADIAKNVVENRLKFIDINYNLQVDNHKYFLSLEQLGNIKIKVKFMQEVIKRNINCINALNKKVEKLEELISLLENANFTKVLKTYEELSVKFQPLLNEHYKKFCKKYKIDNIQEYESWVPKLIHYESSKKALQNKIQTLNDQLEVLSKMQTNDEHIFIHERAQLESIIETSKIGVKKITMQLEEAKIISERNYAKWIEKIVEIVTEKEKSSEISENLKFTLLKICIDINEKRLLLNENYKLLNQLFLNFERMPIEDDNILSQLTFNSEINTSYDLIMHHLEQIRPDYSKLNDELKDITKFKKSSIELQETMSRLKKSLDEFPLDFGGNDDELASLNEKISNLSIEIKNTNNECQKVLGTLRAVTEDRNKRFTECLKIINDEIKKFCRICSKETLYGELMPVNESEPFLGLQYCWQSNNGTEFVGESKRNWEAALAFWFGLARYKKQNFVPYFELSSELPLLNAIQTYSNSSETDLQVVVFWKTGIDEDMCHYTIMRYKDKMRIIDKEEEARKLEILLRDL